MKQARSSPDAGQAVADAVDKLREELGVVRQVLDEILDELQWANRNHSDDHNRAVPLHPLTSMPVDATADDWAERLDRYSADDLPDFDGREVTSAKPGRLF